MFVCVMVCLCVMVEEYSLLLRIQRLKLPGDKIKHMEEAYGGVGNLTMNFFSRMLDLAIF